MAHAPNRITPMDRQLKVIKWAVGLSFVLIALLIYTILSNLGLIFIGVLGYFTYKKFPAIQNKLKPIIQKVTQKRIQ